jgi:Spy/CpxP family protein refolding chaperone
MKATVLALALLCAGAVCAQTPPPEAAHGARHLDDLATLLDLTDAQKAQVQAILQEQHAKMKQSFEQAKASGSRPDFQQMKALHQQIRQETLQKLTPVLSATQLKKYQILSRQMHGRFGHGGPDGATPPPAQN